LDDVGVGMGAGATVVARDTRCGRSDNAAESMRHA